MAALRGNIRGPAGPQGPVGATGATGPQGPVGPQGPQGPLPPYAARTINTDGNGRVTFTFPTAFAAVPVVTATAVDMNTGDGYATVVDIEAVSATAVTCRAWNSSTVVLGGNTLTSAGSGVPIHIFAVKAT